MLLGWFTSNVYVSLKYRMRIVCKTKAVLNQWSQSSLTIMNKKKKTANFLFYFSIFLLVFLFDNCNLIQQYKYTSANFVKWRVETLLVTEPNEHNLSFSCMGNRMMIHFSAIELLLGMTIGIDHSIYCFLYCIFRYLTLTSLW